MSRARTVAPGQISFSLHSLGWKAFQDLCGTILRVVLGQDFQTFAPGRDGGRDGAFRGSWDAGPGDVRKGSFVAQCKFTSRPSVLRPEDLREDIEKAAALAKRSLADHYLLLTNHRLTGASEAELRKRYLAAGVRSFEAFGYEAICAWITENKRLRQLVPRVYGLGDLSQILDERAIEQTEALLESFAPDLDKFVSTSAHREAVRALNEHGFALLLGAPAAGKTTIAYAVAVTAPDLWDAIPLRLDSIDAFRVHWNPGEANRLYWIDDFLGATQLQSYLAAEWNQTSHRVEAAIQRGSKFIITSRDYVFRRGRSQLKLTAFPRLLEAQVVIDVAELTTTEREQILYNHVKLGDQSRDFRRRIKPFLPLVAHHQAFRPEIARRLGQSAFTKALSVTFSEVMVFVEDHGGYLSAVLQELPPEFFATLCLLMVRGGKVEHPVRFEDGDREVLRLMGTSEAEVVQALPAMDGTFVAFRRADDLSYWEFRHPTIRDALAELLASRPDLLDVYVAGTPVEHLLREVSCGDVGLEGVKLMIPESRFGFVAERLREALDNANRATAQAILAFLGTRCSRLFLSRLLESHPGIRERAFGFGSYLSASPAASFAFALLRLDLLTAPERSRIVERLKEQAIEVPDADYLHVPEFREALTEDEHEELKLHVTEQLPGIVDSIVRDWEGSMSDESDPEDHFYPLREALLAFEMSYGDAPDWVERIHGAVEDVDAAIERLRRRRDEWEPDPDAVSDFVPEVPAAKSDKPRGVFDDIDDE